MSLSRQTPVGNEPAPKSAGEANGRPNEGNGDPACLPRIPLINAATPLDLLEHAAHLTDILAEGHRHYGRTLLSIGDRVSRAWLDRCDTPYKADVLAVAERLNVPGAVLLNLSYEWSCTTGVAPDPSRQGNRMLRTLDWPMPGLGRNIVVARHEARPGPYYNVTWPGFVGVLTAMAPGRFSAAINQPPMRRMTPLMPVDWMISRAGLWRNRAAPPSHVLRRMFEACRTYGEAKRLLTGTPLCLPAFFSLSGTAPGEGCTIERTEITAFVHDSPASIANHWIGIDRRGHDRGDDSPGRRALMDRLRDGPGDDFAWLIPPIRNRKTRLAVVANAARGLLTVQGWEADGPATDVFRLGALRPGGRGQTKEGPRPAVPA